MVLDFGGQYKELIARSVRSLRVHSVILPGSTPAEEVRALAPIGIIPTGGPFSVYEKDAPAADPALFGLGTPVLGICYGMQMMCAALGGKDVQTELDKAVERIDSKLERYVRE